MARILVVEDEAIVRQMLRDVLEREGYTVVEADNGVDGLQLCAAEPADLVIVDMQGPVMDGEQLIPALRHKRPALTVLAISGDQQALDRARAIHVQGTLHKPFPLADLLALVQQLVPPREVRVDA